MEIFTAKLWPTDIQRLTRERRTSLIVIFVGLVAFLSCLKADSLPYAPQPPEDWKQHVDPRFEPPVEKTLVDFYYERIQPEELVGIWNGWGFEALERLSALHEEEAWSGFHHYLGYFALVASDPGLRAHIKERLLAQGRGDYDANRAKLNCGFLQSLLLEWYRFERETTHELAATLAREASLCLRETAGLALLWLGDDASRKVARETIDILANSTHEAERAAALRLILAAARNDADYDRALALSQTVDSPLSQQHIEQRRKAARGRWRSEEVMDRGRRGVLRGAPCAVALAKGEKTDADRDRALIQIITDPASDAAARHKAQIDLVNLGTRRCIRAWLDLRDAARAHPDAPEAKEEYTHKEKIYEAFLMYHLFIPKHFGEGAERMGERCDYTLASIQVSEDYCSAILWIGGSGTGSSSYHLFRYGNEWLIGEFGGTVVP